MLTSTGRIFCWYRGFCHRTGSDLLVFLSIKISVEIVNLSATLLIKIETVWAFIQNLSIPDEE